MGSSRSINLLSQLVVMSSLLSRGNHGDEHLRDAENRIRQIFNHLQHRVYVRLSQNLF